MTSLLLHAWTVEDYHQIVATGILADSDCELLRGTIVDMPPEGPAHAHRCETTARYLERLFGEGWWSRQGKPITLADSEPQPDIAIVRDQDYSDRHPIAAEVRLVVEYLYRTQAKDTGIKREIYAEAGSPHYLVIDLKQIRVIHYANPINGNYTSEQVFQTGLIQIGTIRIEVQRLLRGQVGN
jgi:Uma2 family endonuclease